MCITAALSFNSIWRMKILFLSDVPFGNPTSGSEQVLQNQVVGLKEKGFDNYLITRDNRITCATYYDRKKGVVNYCYSLNINRPFSFFFNLFRYTKNIFYELSSKNHFRIVISHQPFTCFSFLVQGKLKRTSLIYIFHSPNHEEYRISKAYKQWHKGLFNVFARKQIEKYCLKKSSKVIVLSQFIKRKLLDTHGLDENKIVVNPGGADLSIFYPPKNRDKLKRELLLPMEKIHLLTIRNLEPRMGLDYLLYAFLILKKSRNNIHLTIGGEGPEKRNLLQLINNYGLAQDVSMPGFIPHDLLPKYYGAADFFVLPTSKLEGFGLVTIESLGCGTPVLGTPIGGTIEILSGINAELIFDNSTPEAIADGIEKAIQNFESDYFEYTKLRKDCRIFVEENYSWNKHVNSLVELIEGIR